MDNLRHLQMVVLSIAKDIDRLCRENGIEYYLGGGGAIGAIRHRGFIPWDDDLDFLMTYDNYERFISVCERSLDKEKYLLEKDCNGMPCSKIRLRGTRIEEKGKAEGAYNQIFLDVFRLEKSPETHWKQKCQYLFSKVYVAYLLAKQGYITSSKSKRLLLMLSRLLSLSVIRRFVKENIFRYNRVANVDTYACLWGTTRFDNSFTNQEIYGKPLYVPFEDTMLPVPERYDEYLTQFFGDYMKLPPVEKRVAPHISYIDFGKY